MSSPGLYSGSSKKHNHKSEISKVENPEVQIIKPKLIPHEDNPFELASDALISSSEDTSMCITVHKEDRIPHKIIPKHR